MQDRRSTASYENRKLPCAREGNGRSAYAENLVSRILDTWDEGEGHELGKDVSEAWAVGKAPEGRGPILLKTKHTCAHAHPAWRLFVMHETPVFPAASPPVHLAFRRQGLPGARRGDPRPHCQQPQQRSGSAAAGQADLIRPNPAASLFYVSHVRDAGRCWGRGHAVEIKAPGIRPTCGGPVTAAGMTF